MSRQYIVQEFVRLYSSLMYQSAIFQLCYTAFSDIFGKFFLLIKLRKNIVVWGKNTCTVILAK